MPKVITFAANPHHSTRTRAFRVEFDRVASTDGKSWRNVGWSAQSWHPAQYGRPTQANFNKFILSLEQSTAPGGANHHLGISQVLAARLVRQSDGVTVATWKPGPFQVVNPGRRRRKYGKRAGRFVAAEVKALRRGSRRVRSRKQAVAVGLSMARRAGVKVPRRSRGLSHNPPALPVSHVQSDRVLDISYKHRDNGKDYTHKFARGVRMQLLADGSVRLYRPDGRSLWSNEFRDE